ncbi:MAG: YceI family protein, partial [bacterium]|nr:YceI family protein [bacterium]
MQRSNLLLIIVALVCLGLGAGGGILVYNAVVGGNAEPSSEISAPTLDVNAVPTQSVEQLSTQVADLQATNTGLNTLIEELQANLAQLGTREAELGQANADLQTQVAQGGSEGSGAEDSVAAQPSATPVPVTPTAEPTVAAAEEATEAPAAEASGGARSLFRIVPEESRVSFFIDEDLFGNRVTVEGTTDQVAGDIIVDFGNPAASQLGTIRTNARTLATDNEFRNQALRARILQSSQDAYEFIEFVPTAITGLPATVTTGQEITFQVVGDLTVRGATRTVTFDVT